MENYTRAQKVELFFPANYDVEEILNLSPEELEVVCLIGLRIYNIAKNEMHEDMNREIIDRVVDEMNEKHKGEVEDLMILNRGLEKIVESNNVRIENMQKQQEDEIQKRMVAYKGIYDSMIDTYTKERETLRQQLSDMEREIARTRDVSRTFNLEMESKVHNEAMSLVKNELDTMQRVLSEKEKQIDTYKALFEKSMMKIESITQKRDVATIGKIGENKFNSLATNVFRDFEGFELIEVYSMGGMGDFHLQFKDMTILVDSKLYSNKVNSTSRDKIKRDLLKNEHIHFAWLVSMDTMVDRFDKAPFMFEWVGTNKCICYINSLLKQEEPGELLRSVWYCCKTMLHLIVNDEMEQSELTKLKENEARMKDIISKLVKNNKERDTLMNQMKQNYEKSDEYIREILNTETNKWAATNMQGVVVNWWNKNMEECVGGEKIKSTQVWVHFKKDMASEIGEMSCGAFKDILCSFLGEGKILKPKVKNGALEIINYRWKNGVNHSDA